ncbi:hypothetical protein HY948_04985 [Candidatus Gottesmanbacteria bacterium]|nr:hypothetical protein [Candidatus Gottesmanbacteria bacterium]
MNIVQKVFAEDLFGTVTNPLPKYGGIEGTAGKAGGLILLFSNILRLVFILAGIYAFLNLIIAGYQYISAAGDSKTLSAAWARIWQSLLGLVIIVGSFALAALFGYIIFGDAMYILNPRIYGPK